MDTLTHAATQPPKTTQTKHCKAVRGGSLARDGGGEPFRKYLSSGIKSDDR